MSYIITSNIDVNHQNKFSTVATNGINKAFSYSNAMDNVVIPSNSEIAVSSVKVTREGQFTLSQDNNRFALYHGAEVDPANIQVSAQSYMTEFSQPIVGTIRGESGGQSSTFSTDDFAKALQESLRLFTFHPSYQKSDLNPSGVLVSASRVANEGFKGFNYSFNQYSGSSVVNNASLLVSPLITPKRTSTDSIPLPLTCVADGNSLKITNGSAVADQGLDTAPYSTILGNRPLSLIGASATLGGGQCRFNLKDFRAGVNGNTAQNLFNFEVGLTRSQKNYQVYDDSSTPAVSFHPPYFNNVDPDGDVADGSHDMGYYDWVVKGKPIANASASGGFDTELAIYHSINVSSAQGQFDGAESQLVEVPYLSGNTPNTNKYRLFNASYSPSGKAIEQVEFVANGETMEIHFIDTDGTSAGKVSGASYTGVTNKSQVLKGIGSTCWSLYPKVLVRGFGAVSSPQTFNTIVIEQYDGVNITDHQYGGLKKTQRPSYRAPQNDGIYDMFNDFYQYSLNAGGRWLDQLLIADCVQDGINFFNADATTTIPSQRNASALSGVTGGKKFLNISNVLMMGDDLNYYTSLARLNCKRILGFPNQSKIVGAYGVVGWDGTGTAPHVRTAANDLLQSAYSSDEAPKLISGESSFIRLRNLATQSYNVANRSFSKILYHIPKFDTSGEEVG